MKGKILFAVVSAAFFVVGCNNKPTPENPDTPPALPDKDIVVMYENDVHCGIEGYAKFAALRSEYKEKTPYVTTVSAGDFVQGGAIASMTTGEGIIRIMNEFRYDIVTPGNHEFDFGMERMQYLLSEKLDATVVSSNICHFPSKELLFAPYEIREYGDVKVAFMGVTTPSTMVATKPTVFLDDEGNRIYDFMNDDLCGQISNMAGKARSEGADYVVLLAHVGVDEKDPFRTGEDIIRSTKGIDVVLDGHSHTVIPDSIVDNSEGKPVHYSSTGTKFQYMGVLTIDTEGKITTRLVETESYDRTDSGIMEFVRNVEEEVTSKGNVVIGHSDFDMSINNAEGKRIVRRQESALGNFIVDSYRDIFHTEIAVANGGGIRETIKAGDITFNNLLATSPFGNTLSSATITGQQLLDALEYEYSVLPDENGSFMHVSGMKLSIDISVTPRFIVENNLFKSVAEDSPRRVSDLMIYNEELGRYEELDPAGTYTIALSNYIARDLGCGGAFRYVQPDADLGIIDVDATVIYLRDALKGTVPSRYSDTEGRITIKGQ